MRVLKKERQETMSGFHKANTRVLSTDGGWGCVETGKQKLRPAFQYSPWEILLTSPAMLSPAETQKQGQRCLPKTRREHGAMKSHKDTHMGLLSLLGPLHARHQGSHCSTMRKADGNLPAPQCLSAGQFFSAVEGTRQQGISKCSKQMWLLDKRWWLRPGAGRTITSGLIKGGDPGGH